MLPAGFLVPTAPSMNTHGQLSSLTITPPAKIDHKKLRKPLKGQLMAGKKVWIHSKSVSELPAVSFVELWSRLVSAVGAEVVRVDEVPQDVLELVEWLSNGEILKSGL